MWVVNENLRVRNDRSVDARPTGGPGAASRFGRRRLGPSPFGGSNQPAGSRQRRRVLRRAR